jgi:hypothetical protein
MVTPLISLSVSFIAVSFLGCQILFIHCSRNSRLVLHEPGQIDSVLLSDLQKGGYGETRDGEEHCRMFYNSTLMSHNGVQ